MPPTLQTERLILRPMRMDDFEGYAEVMQSDHARYMSGPFDRAGAWYGFCHDAAQWLLMGHGALTIETREGEVVGQTAVNSGPLFPEHELGWLLYPPYEGRGYAYEAASAMRDWAFGECGLVTLVSYVDADNRRSRRLAERLGALVDSDAEKPGPGDVVYRHPNPVQSRTA